jgi:hypothetical protein
MPEITADKIIGKTLYANKTIEKLNSSLQKIGTFSNGQLVGIVYSYILRNGNVYWMFYDKSSNPYYVKHTSTSFSSKSGGVSEAFEQVEREKENLAIQQKGKFAFYFEKYGKFVFLYGIAAIVLVKIIKK